MRVIDFLDHGLRRQPNRACLIDGATNYTHGEVLALTHRIAKALRASGLQRGSKVAFYTPNCAHAFAAMIGVFRAGCVWQPVHPRNAIDENVDFLNDNGTEFLFYHSNTAQDARAFKERVASLKQMVCLDGPGQGDPNLIDWTSGYEGEFDDEHGADDVAWVKATGGTTGRSKSAVISHRAATALFSAFHWCMPLPAGHVTLAATPLTHAAGNVSLCTISNGGTIVFLAKADTTAILDAIETHRITTMFLPPTVIYSLLNMPDVKSRDLSSLRYFLYTAAPMSPDKMKDAVELFGPVMVQGWGQAEAPLLCTFMSSADYEQAKHKPDLFKSCGRATPFARVEIMDDDGKILGPGEVGEIVVRSDLAMNGYFNNPEETAKAMRDGWLHSGDVGLRDEDGYFYIVDRSKDMIISGGFNIYPSDIERVLWRHPAVLDCAVVGVPDEKWGEAVKAVVELKDGVQVSEGELRDYCKSSLAAFKAPKTIEIWDALPRSQLGKVLKREIRDRYWEGRARRI